MRPSLNIWLVFVCFGGATADFEAAPDSENLFSLHGTGFISGASRAEFREAPWHAGLYTTTTRPYKQICGATIVTKYAVLTAAHCFTKDRQVPPASHFAVAAGKIYRPWNDPQDKGAHRSEVAEIYIPKRYQGSIANFQHDIAVVTISNWFYFNEFIFPACVSFNQEFDEQQLQEGELGKFVGWGQTGPNTRASQVLQVTSLPSISIDTCIEQSPVSFKSAITGDKFCAGYINGTAVCHGDSGGGLVFPGLVNGLTRMFLRGVASTSPPDENSCNIYTWATFTHLLRHEHFIKAKVPDIEDACGDPNGLGLHFGNQGRHIRIPPRYQGNAANCQDDIAVVNLTDPLPFNGFIEPACVNFNLDYEEVQLREGELGQIAGWGQTGPNAPASQVLQVASLPSVSINNCIEQSPLSFRSAITGDKICTGYYNDTAVCHGDSGGGLVFPGWIVDRYLKYLRGVASTSPPDENSCNVYTWATFTHLLRHEHFIKARQHRRRL